MLTDVALLEQYQCCALPVLVHMHSSAADCSCCCCIWHTRQLAVEDRVLALATDIARAFVYLHHVVKPVCVHRDVKPPNFLLDRSWKVKVTDFGLAANSSKQVRHFRLNRGALGLHRPPQRTCLKLTVNSSMTTLRPGTGPVHCICCMAHCLLQQTEALHLVLHTICVHAQLHVPCLACIMIHMARALHLAQTSRTGEHSVG